MLRWSPARKHWRYTNSPQAKVREALNGSRAGPAGPMRKEDARAEGIQPPFWATLVALAVEIWVLIRGETACWKWRAISPPTSIFEQPSHQIGGVGVPGD